MGICLLYITDFVGNLTTAQNFLHLLCVLLIIAMLGMIAIGVAAWQMVRDIVE